ILKRGQKLLFKKEFDIDKDFFTEESPVPKKRKIALRVFLFVGSLTFLLLFVSAFSFGLNSRFGSNIENVKKIGLKEAQEFFFDALKFYETGEYDSAIEKLNKQLAIVDDPDAYNYLAKI
ncbi:MAG: tetratricopeptide repeat protein, partial [Candidatus Gastranaerophilales bacterium]|nr:tetratricopeptide repeat protein [Candidatus Gastranaerophilales bacterium]